MANRTRPELEKEKSHQAKIKPITVVQVKKEFGNLQHKVGTEYKKSLGDFPKSIKQGKKRVKCGVSPYNMFSLTNYFQTFTSWKTFNICKL